MAARCTVPAMAGTACGAAWFGAAYWRHGMWCRLDMVPAMGGTVLWRHDSLAARFLGGTVPGGTVPWRHGSWRPVRRGARDAKASFQAARRSPDGCGRADRPCLSRGGALCCGCQWPPDWRVASLPAIRGIECETGEPSSVYMTGQCAPDGGIEPPWARTRRSLRPLSFHLDKSGAGGAYCRR